MIPDPFTEEGRRELQRRLERAKRSGDDDVDRSIAHADEEPGGKLTNPNELDIRRNIKSDE